MAPSTRPGGSPVEGGGDVPVRRLARHGDESPAAQWTAVCARRAVEDRLAPCDQSDQGRCLPPAIDAEDENPRPRSHGRPLARHLVDTRLASALEVNPEPVPLIVNR